MPCGSGNLFRDMPDPKITKLNGGTPVTFPSNIPAPSLLRNKSLAMGNTNWPAISAIILTNGNSPPLSSANSSPMARIFLGLIGLLLQDLADVEMHMK